jgi:acetylornithine/N-succinyldiaminopimelate aminotransferase
MVTTTDDPRAALLGVYKVPQQLFVRGEGCELIDEDGRRFLDFTAGIAVNALGFGSPIFHGAVQEALSSGLVHTSNLFRTRPAEELAAELLRLTYPGRVFFCNSGGEAGEACFKFARRWAKGVGGGDKVEFVSFHGAFHGRLFGTLAATDRPDYRKPFEPLMPGVHFAQVEDIRSVEALVSRERTAAVVLETVQGEGGVRPISVSFLRELRELCCERDVALILDEIQCGVGRSGRMFAYEAAGITPDLLSVAKPLGGGLPIGAVVMAPHIAEAIQPGDHGTTFGGGPFVATVALAVLRAIAEPAFLQHVNLRGEQLGKGLQDLQARHAGVKEVRGVGLMWGLELEGPVAPVIAAAREEGLLLVGAGANVIRFLPPLVISGEEIARGLEILDRVLTSV